jgi:uroporphyrinogen III methyltransferase/synthase
MVGKVYLVGAGPGDPGLLTVKGKTVLERADCIVYDFLANEELLAYVQPSCEKVFVGKRAGRHALTQDQINALLVEKAKRGEIVVRLKGGDPFIFGRGGEEAAAVAHARIPFEIVPGVSSGYAVPAYAGIPVTQRKIASSVSFVSLRGADETRAGETEVAPGSLLSDTVIFFMGARNLPSIVKALLKVGRGRDTCIAVIRWGTLPYQETIVGTLGDIVSKAEGLAPPAIAIVGEVVNLRREVQWYERMPLFGKRIVITRPRKQAAPLRDALLERGAVAIDIPTIELRQPDSWESLDRAIRRLEEFDYLLVTSANGVHRFLERLSLCGRDVRDLKGIQIGAIGPATAAEFAASGVRVDFIPTEYRAEGLVTVLGERDLKGKSILIPRARVARDLVPRVLAERGARVEVVEAYQVGIPAYRPEELDALLKPPPDLVTFTSSSTAINFSKLPISPHVRQKLASAKIASIGPVTSETVRSLGMEVSVEAQESTVPGLLAAIEAYFRVDERLESESSD